MVTAAERLQAKNLRRASFATGNNQPGLGRTVAGAAAGAAAAGAVSASDSLQNEQNRFNALQNNLNLAHIQDELEDIEGAIAARKSDGSLF